MTDAETQLEGALTRIDLLERELETAEHRAVRAEAKLSTASGQHVTKAAAAPRAMGGSFDPERFGRHVAKTIRGQLDPLRDRVAALEAEVKTLLDLIAEQEGSRHD